MKTTVRTPQEVRNEFHRKGVSVTEWARNHKVERQIVFDLLSGKAKGRRGKSHHVAVLLGLKEGEIVKEAA